MIIIKNNTLTYNCTSYKCSLGKNGITDNKREGDGCTPSGQYFIKKIFYREDRIKLPSLTFPIQIIKKNLGWCDDTNSMDYNKLIKFPFSENAELLYREDNIYNIICEINYNENPIIKNMGSAIFIHIARDDFSPTEGCIALSENDLVHLLKKINSKTVIDIKI